jgi:hypothetical protein
MNSKTIQSLTEVYTSIYEDALQGRLLKRDDATPYKFNRKGGGSSTTFRATDPVSTSKPTSTSVESPTPKTSPGQLSLNTLRATGGTPGPPPGATVRATGPTGNFPQLNRYINKPSSGMLVPASKALGIARAARIGSPLGIVAAVMEPTPTSSQDTPSTALLSKSTKAQQSVGKYNTMDPGGRIRNRLAVGQGKVGTVAQSFDKEYAKQKSAGAKTFNFQGKSYTTDSYDFFDMMMDYLISEGYADTNKNAIVIMANMSEEWKRSIVEETARTEYLQKKFNKENKKKSGSALTFIPGKQNTGQALQKARESERHMSGDK